VTGPFRVGALLLGAVLVASLSGCAGSGSTTGPRLVAQSFLTAWSQKDGSAACRLLAPDTRAEVAQSAKKACALGILEEDLPNAGSVRITRAWGRAAEVQLSGDTMFLSEFPAGWRILAVGCTPRAGKPYDCQVQGG
jgi:hypothetical protein